MLKWIISATITISLCLLMTIALLQIDDELAPELETMISLSAPKASSNGYFYLLGFMAAAKDNPIDVGKSSFANIHQQQSSPDNVINYPPINALPPLESDLLCAYRDAGCLTTIFNTITRIAPLLAQHQIYIDRFQQFVTFDDYYTLTEPSIQEPLPEYGAIVKAVRLLNLKQIYLASRGKKSEVIDTLLLTHHHLRNMLLQQDSLIGKLISLSLLSENIDLIYLLSSHYQIPIKDKIPLLTQQERDYTQPFSRELRLMNNMFQLLDRRPDIFDHVDQQDGIQLSPWQTRLLYKPNMTSNQSYKLNYYYAQLSTFTIDAFEHELNTEKLKPNIQTHWVRNAIGTVLTQIASPNFSEYIERAWSMNNKINLFNAAIHTQGMNHDFQKVTNIYPALKEQRPYFTENKQQVCLKGPLQKVNQYQCLRVKID